MRQAGTPGSYRLGSDGRGGPESPPSPREKRDRKGYQAVDVALVMFLAGTPLYLLPSGLPQLADWLVPVALGLLVLQGQLALPRRRGFLVATGAFVIWTAICAALWFLRTNELEMLRAPLFYGFNAVVVFLIAVRYRADGPRTLDVLGRGTALAALVCLLLLVLHFDTDAVRQTAGFNNPNQLAYFGILIGGVAGAFLAHGRGGIWPLMGGAVASVFVGMSMSLSGMAALAVMLLGFLVAAIRRGMLSSAPRLLLVLMAGAGIITATSAHEYLSMAWDARLDRVQEKVEEAASIRGYERILEHPQSLLMGQGEGADWRFGSADAYEVHSTLGAMLFYYGLPGLALFLGAMGLALRRSPIEVWLFLGAVITYGLAHHGVRFSWLWIFLAACFLLGLEDRRRREGGDTTSMERETTEGPDHTVERGMIEVGA